MTALDVFALTPAGERRLVKLDETRERGFESRDLLAAFNSLRSLKGIVDGRQIRRALSLAHRPLDAIVSEDWCPCGADAICDHRLALTLTQRAKWNYEFRMAKLDLDEAAALDLELAWRDGEAEDER